MRATSRFRLVRWKRCILRRWCWIAQSWTSDCGTQSATRTTRKSLTREVRWRLVSERGRDEVVLTASGASEYETHRHAISQQRGGGDIEVAGSDALAEHCAARAAYELQL